MFVMKGMEVLNNILVMILFVQKATNELWHNFNSGTAKPDCAFCYAFFSPTIYPLVLNITVYFSPDPRTLFMTFLHLFFLLLSFL